MVDVRMILESVVHSVKLTSKKNCKNEGRLISGTLAQNFQSTYPVVLIFCVSQTTLEVSGADSSLSTFLMYYFSTWAILNYRGKQLVA